MRGRREGEAVRFNRIEQLMGFREGKTQTESQPLDQFFFQKRKRANGDCFLLCFQKEKIIAREKYIVV